MTPKNREELIDALGASIIANPLTSNILRSLEGKGLAIVPKEPTEAMLRPCDDYTDQITNANVYRAMLDASPFKDKG